MRLLELFSGTGSVRKAVGEKFDEIVSLDILEKFNPTIKSDIMTWNYRQYPPGYFDCIWASPPCTEYSAVLYGRPDRPRDLDMANAIVQRTIDIIDYFKPERWFIENPQTGLLKDQEFMWGIPFIDVDYCKYGMPYRKRTRIWTNTDIEGKTCKKDCGNIENGRHTYAIGNSTYNEYWKRGKEDRLHQRYSIPAQLIQELFT